MYTNECWEKLLVSLKDLTIQEEYRSDCSNSIADFYIPCLEQATLYQRAVGFFSSTSLALAAKGLTALIRSGGKMQLIASPNLSKEDSEAIETGLQQKEFVIDRIIQKDIEQQFEEIVKDRLACLSWLLAKGLLEIKLAVPKNLKRCSIYHEKLGIFRDNKENFVCFTGSANESSSALIGNFECIDVFCSWEPGIGRRAWRKAENFQKLWENNTNNLEVIEFPEAARRSLLKFCPDRPPTWEPGLPTTRRSTTYNVKPLKYSHMKPSREEILNIPRDLTLGPHQQQAIREWFSNSERGILEMATGSGKTITALAAATILYQHKCKRGDYPLFILMVCPYLHLIDQWIQEAKRFGLDPLPCAISRTRWQSELSVRIYNSTAGIRSLSSIITTNSTFASEVFQHQISKASGQFLLIVDEVHNLGAEQLRNCLPNNANYRLGLSATPERWFDPTGTEALTNYFGSTLAHYTLADALKDGVLCQYSYHPQLIELNDDEFDRYYELTVKIARILGKTNDPSDRPSTALEALLIQRSRLIATAQGKIEGLKTILASLRESTHNLIYCGDGTMETESEESIERQIDVIIRLLGCDLGMTVAKYTAETPLDRRQELTEAFTQGKIQYLVAIRCLDEGVDIPETKRAFILASSSNPRQFIQRRGRLLRNSPGKQIAEIFDFVVQPPLEFTYPNSEYFLLTRSLFGNELKRVLEFARLAVNGSQALADLLELRDRLNLLDLGIED
jgi:DNA phosphorothioation system restriction enzyme